MKAFMRFFQRAVLVALLIALGTWLFYIGREHQVFLDNKSIERDGRNFRALEQVNVSVNGGKAVELLARDRDVAKAVGPVFSLKVEVLDFLGGDVEKTIELELHPGFGGDMMLSLPLMAAGREDFVLPPPTLAARAADEPAPGAGQPEGGIAPSANP